MKRRVIIPVIFLFTIASMALAQKMTVKDSDSNVLMEVNDEGTKGSITLSKFAPSTGPSTTTDKLYNVDGTLYWNGSSVATGSGLTLPYSGSTSSGSDAFAVTTTGTGRSGYFEVDNTGNSSAGLYAQSNGSGDTIYGYHTGTGRAGFFRINNAANTSSVLRVNSNNDGNALRCYMSGTGRAAYLQIANGDNSNDALYAFTSGKGRAGYLHINNVSNNSDALLVERNGTGDALKVNHTGSSGDIAAFQNSGTDKVTISRDGDGWFAGDGSFEGEVDVGKFFNLTQQTGAQTPSGDAITVTTSHVLLGSTGTDDLETISGGSIGRLLILVGPASGNVTVKSAVNNIRLASGTDFSMDSDDTLMLMYDGINWLEISRSTN